MALTLEGLTKSYGNLQVLKPFHLQVLEGEFLTLLGPSGSGKTTILRLIGGFTQPTTGRLLLNGEDLSKVPTHKRPFNTVFQDYALFPHMTVYQNIAYGLKLRGQSKVAIDRATSEALEVVGLAEFPQRYPSALSGGQRQRVALARAIVCKPKLILLDEPLSALDATLRRDMQRFLKRVQKQIGTSFLFITHDQEEAISISDRLVVMNHGQIEQIGTPREIYYTPKTPFVAKFFGDNNLLEATVEASGVISTPLGKVRRETQPGLLADRVLLAMRPELFSVGRQDDALNIDAVIADVIFSGAVSHVVIKPERSNSVMTIKLRSDPGNRSFERGEKISIHIRPQDIAIVEGK